MFVHDSGVATQQKRGLGHVKWFSRSDMGEFAALEKELNSAGVRRACRSRWFDGKAHLWRGGVALVRSRLGGAEYGGGAESFLQ
ncbi:hypothetical protein ACLB2K_044454 [Fragaria x ananassa]